MDNRVAEVRTVPDFSASLRDRRDAATCNLSVPHPVAPFCWGDYLRSRCLHVGVQVGGFRVGRGCLQVLPGKGAALSRREVTAMPGLVGCERRMVGRLFAEPVLHRLEKMIVRSRCAGAKSSRDRDDDCSRILMAVSFDAPNVALQELNCDTPGARLSPVGIHGGVKRANGSFDLEPQQGAKRLSAPASPRYSFPEKQSTVPRRQVLSLSGINRPRRRCPTRRLLTPARVPSIMVMLCKLQLPRLRFSGQPS